jgi:C4-dicarboxylate transporter DctM subunit
MIAVLFITLAVTLLIGVPVGFSIGISTLAAVLFEGTLPPVIVAQKMIDGANSFSLLALPMFVLSGALMAYGSTPRLMRLANLLVGKIPGGLGMTGVLGCTFFGAVSGSGVATCAAIGGIVGPEMVRKGYGKGFTASLIAASGTLGCVIPPSITFVIYAQSAGVSVGDMFLAGFLPGFLGCFMLCLICYILSKRRKWGGSGGDDGAKLEVREKIFIIVDALIPLFMPIIIIGGVLSGIITATESAVIATVYAFSLAFFFYRELKFREIVKCFADCACTAAMILFIIASSYPFGWLMATRNVPQTIARFILSLSDTPVIIYSLIVIIILILGTFMEGFTIVILTTPIFLPIVKNAIGGDAISYGIVLTLATDVGAVTPPLAVCLFTACSILKMRVEETFPDIFFILGTMTFETFIVMLFPAIATFLPNLLR